MIHQGEEKKRKPLGRVLYGSIPHLPGSRLGIRDWSLNQGQARILLEKPRAGDRVIAVAKLDGACVGVARCGDQLLPLIRAGYLAAEGDYEQLRMFDRWARRNLAMFDFLRPGERVVGEWLAQACGTIYDAGHRDFHPFVAFDLIRFRQPGQQERVLQDEFAARVGPHLPLAAVLVDAERGVSIEEALQALGAGRHGEVDPPEGVVWRVEREGRVDFLAKYVRPDKADGLYLPEISGRPPIWHWREMEAA